MKLRQSTNGIKIVDCKPNNPGINMDNKAPPPPTGE